MKLYCYKPTYTCAEPMIIREKPIWGYMPYMAIEVKEPISKGKEEVKNNKVTKTK